MKKKNILFVCKYNRFRSRIAEAYFKRINKDFNVESAGLIKGNPLDKEIIKEAKEFGLRISGNAKPLSSKLLSKTDIIVIVADDVPKEVFKYQRKYIQKIIQWKIKDLWRDRERDSNAIIKEIMKKVDNLVKQLEKKLK